MSPTFFGIYRGRVEANLDPMTRGRVQVSVPAVLGDGRLAWAEPCAPYAGGQVGLATVPPVGTSVWVQFEGGDPDYPILVGCFWESGESPAPGLPDVQVFATDGVTVTASSVPGAGGLTIEVGAPAVATPIRLVMGSSGIELSMGASTITLDGVKVSVNNGALEVM